MERRAEAISSNGSTGQGEGWLCNQSPGLRLPGAGLSLPVKCQSALRLAPWVLLTLGLSFSVTKVGSDRHHLGTLKRKEVDQQRLASSHTLVKLALGEKAWPDSVAPRWGFMTTGTAAKPLETPSRPGCGLTVPTSLSLGPERSGLLSEAAQLVLELRCEPRSLGSNQFPR